MGDAVGPGDLVPVLGATGVRMVTPDGVSASPLALIAALTTALAAAVARIAILEAKPEEVAHFTGQATFPTAAVGATFVLKLTGIVPARAGDALKPGEQIEVWPTGTVPAGLRMDAPSVASDGSVLIPCAASLAVSAGAAPVPFAIAALR